MKKDEINIYARMKARYETGDVPWDESLPPPEVIAYLTKLEPGRALDLGCGFGRATIYMALLGWDVDAIDFIPDAIAEASRRAEAARVKVHFHVAKVTEIDFLNGPYDFALDVGCGHSLDTKDLLLYEKQLSRLIRQSGTFMLFARTQGADEITGEGPPFIDEAALLTIFASTFELEWLERGITVVENQTPWTSAWFLFRRL